MNLNIVIDIDGTITKYGFVSSFKGKGKTTDIKRSVIKNNVVLRKTAYGIVSLYTILNPIDEDASKTIQQFKTDGDTNIIITKRYLGTSNTFEGKKTRNRVEKFLINHDIPYDEIRYVDSDKVAECTDVNADVIIEDDPHNINALAKAGFRVICLNRYYNKHIIGNPQNIFIANNWQEVYNIVGILRMQKVRDFGPKLSLKKR